MKNPLAYVALLISLGIWIGSVIRIPVAFITVIAGFLFFISSFTLKKRILAFSLIAVIFVLTGYMFYWKGQLYPVHHIKNWTNKAPLEVCVEGIIINQPHFRAASYGGGRFNFTIDSIKAEKDGLKKAVSGKVGVNVYTPAFSPDGLRYGDRVVLKGLLSTPRTPGNLGEFDYARYLERKGIFSLLNVKAADFVVVGRSKGNPIVRAAYDIRDKIERFILSYLPRDKAVFLNAILLGSRDKINDDLNDDFVKTGTVHLLAISGLNVGLIASLFILIFNVIRIPRRINVIAVIFLLIFYAILTNNSPSVLRATVMAVAVLAGFLIGRESSIWNSLGLSAIIILGFDPNALFEAGFQLSFVSLMSILYITPALEKFFNYDRKLASLFKPAWNRYLADGFFISLAAWIGVLPLVLFYFRIVTPITVLANLFAVPLSFLITASSVPFVVLGLAAPFFAKMFAGSVWLFCEALFLINSFLSEVPFAYAYLPRPPLYLIVLYYFFMVVFIEHERLKISTGKILIAVFIVSNAIIWQGALRPSGKGMLTLTFLDVGHGDSVFVEFPYGGNMLIDAGGGSRDTGNDVILPFLRDKGVCVIDALVMTHTDLDHIGGMSAVLEGIRVNRIFDNGSSSDTRGYLDLNKDVLKRRIRKRTLNSGDALKGFKGADILCFNPPSEWKDDREVEENEKSVVLRIGYKETGVLMCGDIADRSLSEIRVFANLLNSDVFMSPHHGQALTYETGTFIGSIKPRYAVISEGSRPDEIARSVKTEDLLRARGIKVFRTNRDGAVTISSDGREIFCYTLRKR